jgi:hypothetical protein
MDNFNFSCSQWPAWRKQWTPEQTWQLRSQKRREMQKVKQEQRRKWKC